MGSIRIGISGWNYDEWRGDFYPEGLRKADQLAYAASTFDTIEVNGTFYGLVSPSTVRHWREQAPTGFVFAVKGSQYLTHTRKLKDPAGPLANFLAQGVLELDDMLGPILWQLPGRWRFTPERIEEFLALLPHDTEAAADLARRHDDRVAEPAYGLGTRHRLRHVLEVRDPSFLSDDLVRLARRHGVALAFSHAGDWPYTEEITAGFVYVRLHGTAPTYASPYGRTRLDAWARRIRTWADGGQPDDAVRITDRQPPPRKGRDVYVYLDNDQGGHAPREAALLRSLVDEQE